MFSPKEKNDKAKIYHRLKTVRAGKVDLKDFMLLHFKSKCDTFCQLGKKKKHKKNIQCQSYKLSFILVLLSSSGFPEASLAQ